jgi:hypothetical protein
MSAPSVRGLLEEEARHLRVGHRQAVVGVQAVQQQPGLGVAGIRRAQQPGRALAHVELAVEHGAGQAGCGQAAQAAAQPGQGVALARRRALLQGLAQQLGGQRSQRLLPFAAAPHQRHQAGGGFFRQAAGVALAQLAGRHQRNGRSGKMVLRQRTVGQPERDGLGVHARQARRALQG